MRGMMKGLARSDDLKDMTEGLNTRMDCIAAHITKVEHKFDAVETKFGVAE